MRGVGGLPERRPDQQFAPPPNPMQPGAAAGIFRGRLVVISGTGANTGLFVYSPVPGAGNLIASLASSAGVDPYGNPYPQGLFTLAAQITGTLTAGSILNTSIGSSAVVSSSWQGGTITETAITFDTVGGDLLMYSTATSTATLSGAGNWTAPAGVTSVQRYGVGGGAGGGGSASFGNRSGVGGGGGESAADTAAVTAGNSYAYSVGAGGAGGVLNGAGGDGGDTTMASDAATLTAHGAIGRSGGTGSVNATHFAGGSGGGYTVGGVGGGGGGSGGSSNAGNSGLAGGTGAGAVAGGGAGGANRAAGGAPGGGGGGGDAVTFHTGGAGAAGTLILTWTTSKVLIGSASGVAGTDAGGNAFPAGFMGSMVAKDPVASPTVAETWHALPLATGWTAAGGGMPPRYKLLPDGLVAVQGDIQGPAAGWASGAAFTTALPAAYQGTHNFNSNAYITTGSVTIVAGKVPVVFIGTNGIMTLLFCSTGSASQAFGFNAVYPLD